MAIKKVTRKAGGLVVAIAIVLSFASLSFSQVLRDGSVGPDVSVQPVLDSNNRYLIAESMGALLGDNADALLHSFSDFSILQGQQVEFTGNNAIQTIISRVTGASPSMIDGTLTSSVPGAHFFLLNPRGVLFGADATLNMGGDFSVSTTDTLLFSDGASLQVYSGDTLPIIKSPTPAAFGFLSDNAGSIVLDSAGSHNGPAGFSSGNKITLHGNDVSLKNGSVVTSGDKVTVKSNSINIDGTSRIQVFTGIGRTVSGDIELSAQDTIAISGESGSGSLVSIGQDGFLGGTTRLEARQIRLENGAKIQSNNNSAGSGPGTGNDITLTAEEGIYMSGVDGAGKGATLLTRTSNETAAGAISLTAPIVEMADGADILSLNPGGGSAGNVNINASDSLTLSGNDSEAGNVDQANIQTLAVFAGGDAGAIDINVGTLNLDNGARIQNGSEAGGNGNTISINATDSITMRGHHPVSGFGSAINSSANGFNQAGNAGDVVVNAPRINMDNGARISSGSVGAGNGGDIVITASQSLNLSGRINRSGPADAIEGDNNGSRIEVQAFDGSTGDAGSITIDAGQISMTDDAIVLSNAYAGEGGDITMTADRIVSQNSDIVSSVRNAQGNGGDVILGADLLVLSNSNIKARADAGNGGTINIENVRQYVTLAGSELDASSTSGIDGAIITPPELRGEFGSDALTTEFLDVTSLLKSSCANYTEGSRFIVASQQGVAASPEGLLPSFAPLISAGQTNALAQHNSAETLRGQARAQQASGDYTSSAKTLADAVAIAKQTDDPFRIAASLGDLGNALLVAGKRGSAEKVLFEAIDAAKQTADPGLTALLYNNLGNYYVIQNEPGKALNAYQRSAAVLAASSPTAATHALEATKAHANIARLHIHQGNLKQAIRALAQADIQIRAAELNQEYTGVLIHVAKSYEIIAATKPSLMRASLLNAHRYLRGAENLSRGNDDPRVLSYALGNLGALYRIEGRLSEALVLTRRALSVAERAQAPESVYRWHWQEGQLLHAQGDALPAIQAFRRAVNIIDASRQATLARYDSAEEYFNRLVAPVYLELVSALLDTEARSNDQAASQQLLLEARGVIEKFKTAELQNYFRDECVLKHAAEQKPLDSISSTTAVVYPIVLPDRMELLLSVPDAKAGSKPGKHRIERYSVAVNAKDLALHVQTFRRHVDRYSQQQTLLTESQWLYQRLVEPYIATLNNTRVDTLVFVPTGVLSLVPLAALHDGKHFIVRDYALATTSGLSLTNPRPLPKHKNKVLLSGVSESVGEFPALDAVLGELNAIKTLYGGDVLLNQDFTADKFEQKIRDTDYSIIHIASHAQFTGKSADNFLRAYDKPMYLDDLSDALSATKYRDRPLELLVLSACQTASGDARAALGLAGVGIKAGARSALATLWSVADDSAAELVETFYSNLKTKNISKAQALRQAQVALLDQQQFAHPFHWSAFLLIDNWL
ncbi:MAG: CHAT domain-containing protein [Gammaproteobacteria bacterium]